MIVDRILKYLESPSVRVEDTVLNAAELAFGRSIVRNLTVDSEERTPRISPSGPWYCPRRYHYMLTSAAKEDLSARSRMAFTLGDTVEAISIILMRLAGVKLLSPTEDGEQKKVSAVISGVPVDGSLDGSLQYGEHGEIPLDVKSMADYGFKEFQKACTDPKAPWWNRERFGIVFQLRLYKRIMKEMGLSDGQHGIFVGVNKNTGHLAECWVGPSDDDKLVDRAVASIAKNLETGGVPDRPSWSKTFVRHGSNLLPDKTKGPCLEIDTDKKRTNDHGWRCNYCPFTEVCYPGFGVVPLSGGPKYRKPLEPETAGAGKVDDASK